MKGECRTWWIFGVSFGKGICRKCEVELGSVSAFLSRSVGSVEPE